MENMIHIVIPIAGGLFLILAPWLCKPSWLCKASSHPRFKIGSTLAGCFALANGACKILIASTSIGLSQPTFALLEHFKFVFGSIALGNLLILLLFAGVVFENKKDK